MFFIVFKYRKAILWKIYKAVLVTFWAKDSKDSFIQVNNILEANRALFAGGELDEEAKDAFYQAVTKAYLSCKMEAKKHLGEKRNQRKNRRCRIFRTPLLLHYNL